MYDVAYGDEAKSWANRLILGESRGPGDIENAMRRIEMRYGIPYAALWALRYKPTKDPKTSLYFRLQAAWSDFRDRQLRTQLKALQDDVETAKASRPDSHTVHAAAALVERAVQAGLIPRSPSEEGGR